MTLQERLDADLRGQLRRGRPLPVVMAQSMGEPLAPPRRQKPKPPPVFDIPRIIPLALMCRADNLQVQTHAIARQLSRMVETTTEMEDILGKACERPTLDMRRIMRAVSEISGVGEGHLVSPRRARFMARPRQVVMYIARTHTGLSLPTIGRWLGHRDHTTVMHGSQKIKAMLEAGDEEITALVSRVEAALGKRSLAPC